jgi:hypothetical protein
MRVIVIEEEMHVPGLFHQRVDWVQKPNEIFGHSSASEKDMMSGIW